ncbi:hypothetical protein GEA64_00270 [Photorhabdus khanii]|uniref:Uncharacterized protein n=1 Tax=Photorhabdus khanii TaxID=1004150 RepID=A0A7C9GJV9_9GAMM|nr:hypothetical protein [Photorhabdus khanii]MQL46519.1 hypothetical protein [Photorhabdus khanii]
MKYDIYAQSKILAIFMKDNGMLNISQDITSSIEYSSTATEILMKIRFILKKIDMNDKRFSVDEINLIKEILNEINKNLK